MALKDLGSFGLVLAFTSAGAVGAHYHGKNIIHYFSPDSPKTEISETAPANKQESIPLSVPGGLIGFSLGLWAAGSLYNPLPSRSSARGYDL